MAIFAVCIVVVINLILAEFMKQAAYAKGYDDNAHAFAMVFWLGVFGCLYVIALPDLRIREQNEKIIELLSSNKTPDVEETIKLPEI